jgi:hypothetical protein
MARAAFSPATQIAAWSGAEVQRCERGDVDGGAGGRGAAVSPDPIGEPAAEASALCSLEFEAIRLAIVDVDGGVKAIALSPGGAMILAHRLIGLGIAR